jgi:hypothetical protein
VLTLKLKNKATDRLHIVVCSALDVVPLGNGDQEITTRRGDAAEVFIVSAKPDGFNVAYIENASATTTQVVRPGEKK